MIVKQLENTIHNFVDCLALQLLVNDLEKLSEKFDSASIDKHTARALKHFIKNNKKPD